MLPRTIGVVGAGQMGNGIAHASAAAGFEVILTDLESRFLEKARGTIEKNLDREVSKGKRSAEEKDAALARVSTVTGLERLSAADLVIEAIVEDEARRRSSSAASTGSARRPRSWPPTRPRSRSPGWPPRPVGRIASSGCTS